MARVRLGLFGVICEVLSHLTYYCEAHAQLHYESERLIQFNITNVRLT